MNRIKIRKFRKEDAIKTGNVVKRAMIPSLRGVPREGTREILSRYNPKNFLKPAEEAIYFVAEDTRSGKILGVIALKSNEVETFYVDPKHQGKGIGRLLFNRLTKEALKRGYKKLITRSSPVAEPVYKALGFKALKKEWQEADGRRFYNIWMEQAISD